MIKWHIDNEFTQFVKKCARFNELTEEEHERLYSEVRNAILQGADSSIWNLALLEPKSENKVQSLLLWVVDATDEKPTGKQVLKSQGSMADFDIDFSKVQRNKVFDYLKHKYGSEYTANVGTFSRLTAKAAVKSAQRALGFPIEIGSLISKNIPNVPDIKLQDAIDANEALRTMMKSGDTKIILETALKLEGLPQALGMHACAFIISDKTLDMYLPQMVSTRTEGAQVLTQFEYKDAESLGLIKFDLLGIKTLDVIDFTVKLVKERKGIDIDIEAIDVNDPGIYKLLNEGFNTAIFQFESDIFLSAINKIRPQNVNELSDITSLNRPGPISMGMLDQYVNAKFKGDKYRYNLDDQKLIDKVWEICNVSYGLMVYQEQAIKCFAEIGGFNEIEADNARRAMGKKKPEEMAKLSAQWLEGGKAKGYSQKDLQELFNQIEGFSGYAFNRSHAICYSFITAWTAYLSYYYPLEFYASLLTIDSDKTDDIRRYISAIKQRGIKLLSPRINRSEVGFCIKDDEIIFGLSGIKGVGKGVSKKILDRRPKKGYKTLGHFVVKNIDILNKKIVEQYAKAGLFADFGINKESSLKTMDNILSFIEIQKSMEDYHTLFNLINVDLTGYFDNCEIVKVDIPDDLSYEVDTLGLYITKHPLEDMRVDANGACDISEVKLKYSGDDKVTTVGAICAIEVRKTKAKVNMASFELTTPTDAIKCIVFPKAYAKLMNKIDEGKVVVLDGIIKEEEDLKFIMVNDIHDDFKRHLSTVVQKESDAVKWITNIDSFSLTDINKIGIIINPSLSYILER